METSRIVLRVERYEINYLRITIESYDGMAVVRTIDPDEALIELRLSPGCEIMISDLLISLREKEKMKIEELSDN